MATKTSNPRTIREAVIQDRANSVPRSARFLAFRSVRFTTVSGKERLWLYEGYGPTVALAKECLERNVLAG